MSYPTAYRGAAARASAGSQKSSPVRSPRSPRSPRPGQPQPRRPRPAPPGRRPTRPARPTPRPPAKPNSYTPLVGPTARIGGRFARGVLKLHPYFRLASTLYDLAGLWIGEDPFKLALQLMSPSSGYKDMRLVNECSPNGDFYSATVPCWLGDFDETKKDVCFSGQAQCLTLDEALANAYPGAIVHKTKSRVYAPGVYRSATTEIYEVTGPNPGEAKAEYAYPQPHERYVPFWPSVAPENVPIHQPMPTPEPVPYRLVPHRRPDPDAVPGHRWSRGPARQPRTPERPYLRPSEQPATRLTVTMRPDGTVRRTVEPHARHVRRQPGRREKERKFRGRGAQAMVNIARAIGFASEVGDLFEVAHDSLPKQYRTATDKFGKAEEVFRHSEHIDWEEFWRNWAGNDLEDRAVGPLLGGPHGRKIGWAFNGQ